MMLSDVIYSIGVVTCVGGGALLAAVSVYTGVALAVWSIDRAYRYYGYFKRLRVAFRAIPEEEVRDKTKTGNK